jgi:hypothetical protein
MLGRSYRAGPTVPTAHFHGTADTRPNNGSATPTVIDARPVSRRFFRAHPLR